MFSSVMLDNLTSALLETILIAGYLSMIISFKEAICDEESLPHEHYPAFRP